MPGRGYRIVSTTPAGSPKSWRTGADGRPEPDPAAGVTEYGKAVIETDLNIGRSMGGGSFREVYIGDELPEGSITRVSADGLTIIPPDEGSEFTVRIGEGETSVGKPSEPGPYFTANDLLEIERNIGLAEAVPTSDFDVTPEYVRRRLPDGFGQQSSNVLESEVGRMMRLRMLMDQAARKGEAFDLYQDALDEQERDMVEAITEDFQRSQPWGPGEFLVPPEPQYSWETDPVLTEAMGLELREETTGEEY